MNTTNPQIGPIVVDGFLFEIVTDQGVLPRDFALIVGPVVDQPQDGGRVLRVEYNEQSIAFVLADAINGRWSEIEVLTKDGGSMPFGAVELPPGDPQTLFWDRVVTAIDVACGIMFGPVPSMDAENQPDDVQYLGGSVGL